MEEMGQQMALMSERMPTSCPADSYQSQSYCYWVSGTSYSWTDGKQACRNRNMSLASIHNKLENDFVSGKRSYVFLVIKISKPNSKIIFNYVVMNYRKVNTERS